MMDRQLLDLAREFVELGFYTLIMLGLCTTAICLTRVWATQELVKAIKAGQALVKANEGQRSIKLIPHLSSLSYSSVR